jgi:3-dehydroquinate synthase
MGRAFLVIDLVLKHSASAWWEGLRAAGWQVEIRWVRATEALKSLSSLEPIYHWLIQKGADRQSVIFAIGGGTVGDAVGFVAGTYLRGVRWVSVPTTLLAQVDSGLGGKTAVNHSQGKNLIGVFHQPVAVLCDSEFLRTLPTREFISGWGEIIKYGIALDGSLFRFLATHSQRMVHEIFEDPGVAEYLVSTCLKLKKVAVEKDELDQNGVRAILNFGHTLGHVFEAETGYGYFRHGEAVIWGMRGAVRLSVLRGLLSEKKGIELDQFLSSFKIPPLPTGRSFSSRLRLLKNDKKSTSGVLKFVLLQGIGKSVVDQAISPEEIREALRWLSQKKGVKN